MAETPDIARLVSLIMENPALIEQISRLATEEGKPPSEGAETTGGRYAPSEAEPAMEVAANPAHSGSDRARLLSAMKPYLSNERAKAIDSFLAIADVLDVMKKGR